MNAKQVILFALQIEPAEVAESLRAFGWQPVCESDPLAAGELIRSHQILVGLVMLARPEPCDLAGLQALLQSSAHTEWIALTTRQGLESEAVRSMILESCCDYHTLPVDSTRLLHSLGHARGRAMLRELSGRASDAQPALAGMVGRSRAMRALEGRILKIAPTDAPVLILGESGCGKELAARAIHLHSTRSGQRFVAVNCAALPAALIQSELFGYERGAFTGATQTKKGLMETAHGGTVFLDEIGDLPLEQQTSLLRFLATKTISRVGSSQDIPLDVRVLAATHVDLQKAIPEGRFRQDLYYRLNVLTLHVPPLRERPDDIELLADHYLRKFFSERANRRLRGFGQRAMQAMLHHDWPGNVRELINRVRSAVILTENSWITPEDLGFAPGLQAAGVANLEEVRIIAERDAIITSLMLHGYNISHAARGLGVSRVTLYRLLAKHRIDIARDRPVADPVPSVE